MAPQPAPADRRLPRQCVVLVGGLGTRLGELAAVCPKPLLEVCGRPFLSWVLREALRWGFDDLLLLAGHRAHQVHQAAETLGATLPRPVRIRVSEEPDRAGTGGALHHARALLDRQFVLLNGDSVFAADLGPALTAFARDGDRVAGRMVLRAVDDAARYGVVERSGDRVSRFLHRPDTAGPGLINSGIYLLDRHVAHVAAPASSLERDVLPRLAAGGSLRASVAEGYFIDIGVPGDLARARDELARKLVRPALLLGQDALLPRGGGWAAGAQAAAIRATRAGWHVLVVTAKPDPALDQIRRAGGAIEATGPDPATLARAWEPARCLLIGADAGMVAAARDAGMAAHRFLGGNLDAMLAPLLA